MTTLQQGIITLIRSSLTQQALALPQGFDMEDALETIRKHQIPTMAYDGAVRCGIDKSLPGMQALFQSYLKCMMHSERQLQQVARLTAAFDENAIDYLPLKGCILKAMYPKPELRQMGDADILIRVAQYDRIRPLLTGLGFTEEQDLTSLHFTWRAPSLTVELHKQMVDDEISDFARVWKDGWDLARPVSGCRYEFSPEDTFLFLFTHFTKHYRISGIGCRHVVDLWVYLQHTPGLNEVYIDEQLERLHLREFWHNIRDLLRVWFEDQPENEKTGFITDVIFRSGVYGTLQNRLVSEATQESKSLGSVSKSRLRRISQLLFPAPELLKDRYPVLQKAPVLVPFCWAVRGINVLLFRRDKLQTPLAHMQITSAKNIRTFHQALNYVGLDFYSEDP